MVRPAARRASARTMAATRSSAGDSEGLIPRRRMSSDALAAPAGDEAPSSVLGMGLRYGVAAGEPPTVRREGAWCLLAVEQDAARSPDDDVVDGDAPTEVAPVGRVPPAQQLRPGRQLGPHLHPAPRAGAGDDAVGRLGLPAVDDVERQGRPR